MTDTSAQPAAAGIANTGAMSPATEIKSSEAPADPTHCPYRQSTLLQQALTPDKMRVAFLLGAGCPVSIRVPDGKGTRPLIPDIAGLTKQVRESLEASHQHKDGFAAVVKRLVERGNAQPNIEQLLSLVRGLGEVVGTTDHDGLSADSLKALDKEICNVTVQVVHARLPSQVSPYHHLATWIGAIQRRYAVEVFTSNYDLLAEQALEERRVPYFDGFVGSDRAFFDLPSMEQDNLPPRWARLWKVHGSINWCQTADGHVERRSGGEDCDRVLIHPSHLKYEQSRRMPYLAMLDRLRAFLGQGQAVLVTCGYSFSDQHLNDVILQGLSGNPTAICFGLLFGDRGQYPEAMVHARRYANLSLLAADGAILGTIERDWLTGEKPDHPLHALAVQTGEMKHRTAAPPDRCKFLLGDFKALGDFLARQLASRDDIEGEADGA